MRDVATIVATRLREHNILISIVGGSAVTLHAPQAHTSLDIDLAVLSGIERKKIDNALASLGYVKKGRNYAHTDSPWTIDVVADTPFIGRRAIDDFAKLSTQYGDVLVLRVEDALADRITHFLHWGDSEALAIAEELARAKAAAIDWDAFARAIAALDASDNESKQRLDFAVRRLKRSAGRDR